MASKPVQEWQTALDNANAQLPAAQLAVDTAYIALIDANQKANNAEMVLDLTKKKVPVNLREIENAQAEYNQALISAQNAENTFNAAEARLADLNNTITTATKELSIASPSATGVQNPIPLPVTDDSTGIDTALAINQATVKEPATVSDEEVTDILQNLPTDTNPIPDEEINNSFKSISTPLTNTRSQPTLQDQANFNKKEDWRVRLSLAPGTNYLYNADKPGILGPLKATKGVIFPYTPSIQLTYAATYAPEELTHSNYKVYQYKNSSVDSINISCEFTAQDTFEANYLLAVIHFFRTVTKMFYGKDENPKRGTPPPLCFLTGLGAFQFNEHPLAITTFTYTLPTEVDYIRARQITASAGVNQQSNIRPTDGNNISLSRLQTVDPGGLPKGPKWSFSELGSDLTYVPTKIQLQIGAVPIVSRNDISNNFSVKDYASGNLLKGIQNVRGGFW